MKELLERMKAALNKLEDKELQLIQDSDVFYESAIKQITEHLEYVARMKEERS